MQEERDRARGRNRRGERVGSGEISGEETGQEKRGCVYLIGAAAAFNNSGQASGACAHASGLCVNGSAYIKISNQA